MGNVDSQLAVLENQTLQNSDFISRLDQNLIKLTELSVSNNKILAIHNEKLERHETKQVDLNNRLELQRQEMSTNIKEIYKKFDETTKSIGADISDSEKKIMSSIDELKRNLKEDLKYHIERQEKSDEIQEELDDRLEALEKWRYMLVGAGIAGGFFLTKALEMIDFVVK